MTTAVTPPDCETPSDTDIFAAPPRFRTFGGRMQLVIKRLIDVVAAVAGLVVLSPLLAAIALFVWADSGLPMLYRWRVVGRGGRYFTGYKFRTMIRDADRVRADLLQHNEMSGPVFKMRNDPRITRAGRLLRRYSLDELPQLWSVLCGRMSLVGPRPPLQREYERFEPWHRRKLSVTPGVTCLWQIEGRADIADFDRWVRLDLEYIDRWSLWLDVKILWRTVRAVIAGRGAY